ncbi:hypothetical protein HELRODRAFT_81128 [Helobdella robusta]|uniref:Cholesterol side-chain cleavage enzyme, mitochondrial n=1 Tax=Helobdella robusta TaxID=6412 RepID=T1G497_HELRO|nr:hypothetical protein HELRODRAFT_81128 [Helobdella robusta]ESO02810.1 hypothetical protein HELRODRAFT_81128 [Helobdella robusta]
MDLNLFQASLHRKYGKMFREKWGPKWQVHVSDPDLIEEIYRHEGRYPFRPSLQPWLLYRQIKNLPHGITTAQGMEWQHYRTEFGKRLFCPSATKSLIEPLSNVADDFVTKVETVLADCNQNFDDNCNKEIYFAKQLPNISYLWSLEAAGSFLFETRLGCLAPSIPTRTQKFLDSLQEMMTSSLYLIVGEKIHQRLNTRFWRKHEKSWDNIFSFGKTLIDEKLLSLESSEEVTGPYLSHLLKNKNLTMNQIYTNITELLMAGSDTTANTFCFVLYMLANNPDKQNLLRQEIQSIMSMSSFAASHNHLEDMKYLKCVIKETMRLYPVVTMNCRVLNQDIQLDGYTIPKETLFVMNHYAASIDEDNFHDPNKFLPERWLREGDVSQQQHKVQQQTDIKKHPFASLPFGYGSRSCLGKHVGKMELMVTLIKVLDKFDVKPLVEQQDLKPVLRTLLTPGQLVPVRLCRRY